VYSGDGSLLVYPTSGDRPSIAVRDAHTLRLLRRLTLAPLRGSGASPDMPDALLLVAPDRSVVYAAYQALSRADRALESTYLARWSLSSGQRLSTTRIDGAGLLAVGLSDFGARLVAVDAQTISVFDTRTVRRLSAVAIRPALTAPAAAAISPDGHAVAVASHSGTITFIDTRFGDAHNVVGPSTGPVTELTYSPDNRAVASAANNAVTIWDPRSRTSTTVFTIPVGQVQPIAFSPDGRTLYTSSIGGLMLEWDLTGQASFGQRLALSGRSPSGDPVAPPAPPLALSPDGTRFAVRLGAFTVGLFSVHTLRRLGSFRIEPGDGVITALAWSPNAQELAIGGHSGLVQLWRIEGTPLLARSLSGLQPPDGQPEAIQAIAFSPDGHLLAASDTRQAAQSAGEPSTSEPASRRVASLAIWRTDTGKLSSALYPLVLGTGHAPFDPLAFSPNSRLVAISAPDGSVRIIDAATAQARPTPHPIDGQSTTSLAFSPEGTLATGSLTGIVQLWDPISGAQAADPLPVSAGPVSSIAFDSTGRRFATTASQDGTVKLFATSTLQQEGTTLNTGQGAASTAAFGLHGNSLLVVDDDGHAYIWPVSLSAWQQRACTIAGSNLTRQEWDRLVPGQSYRRICP
jgi:WD40 repeat protein